MTKGDLYKINIRIDEIERAIDLCSDKDSDVLINLENELDEIIKLLENTKDFKNTTDKLNKGDTMELKTLQTKLSTEPAYFILTIHYQNLVNTFGQETVNKFFKEIIFKKTKKNKRKAS